MNYKIVPNFLPPNDFDFIHNYTINILKYKYNPVIGLIDDTSGFYFANMLYYFPNNSNPDPEFFKVATPLLYHGNLSNIYRFQVNCFIKQPNHIFTAPHHDQSFPHKVLLYSVNTNNGYTVLDPNGKNLKIPSVANQAIFFDGDIEHQAVTQTDENVRVNININYN